MSTVRLDELSPFGRLALQLDNDFSELVRLGGQIDRLDIESDSGLDHAIKILNLVGKHGESIAQGMVEFSKSLHEARERSEAATRRVAERAQLIEKRWQHQQQLQQRLAQVEEEVKAANRNLSAFRKPGNGEVSDDARQQIAAELERLQAAMTRFIETAQAIKAEAGQSKFRRLEREAGSIIETLQSSRRKIQKVLG